MSAKVPLGKVLVDRKPGTSMEVIHTYIAWSSSCILFCRFIGFGYVDSTKNYFNIIFVGQNVISFGKYCKFVIMADISAIGLERVNALVR